MQHRYTTVLLALACAILPAGVSFGQICETTFTGITDTNWNEPSNWSFGTPNQNLVACVPAGLVAQIVPGGEDGECQALVIERSGSSIGIVSVDQPRMLTIFENSRIDGRFVLGGSAVLRLANDLTIHGNGGEMRQAHSFGGTIAIKPGSGPKTLTLQGDDNSSRSTSITLRNAWTVQVGLVNNGYVVADFGVLALQVRPISGNGFFIANDDDPVGGQLLIGAPVSGSATWEIHGAPTVEIEIDAACPNLTGDFKMDGGLFDVNADFKTTGTLNMQSINGSAPVIDVAKRVSAEFDS